jgi:chemotaxis protein CheX
MKVEYINPFVVACSHALESCLNEVPSKGDLSIRYAAFTSQQCSIIATVSGMIEGQVVYGMSLITADKIASTMVGEPIRTFDQVAAGAVKDLGDMIIGRATWQLCAEGYMCDIAPPTIVRGSNVKLSEAPVPSLVVPIYTTLGKIEMALNIRERK